MPSPRMKAIALEALKQEWRSFCFDSGLPLLSADELLVSNKTVLSAWQEAYIKNYINRWQEELMK